MVQIESDYLDKLIALQVAARELVDEIERCRPLDLPYGQAAFRAIEEAQDRVIAALDALEPDTDLKGN